MITLGFRVALLLLLLPEYEMLNLRDTVEQAFAKQPLKFLKWITGHLSQQISSSKVCREISLRLRLRLKCTARFPVIVRM